MEKIGTNEVNAMIRSSHAHKLLFVATGKVEEAKHVPYSMYARALSTLISAVDMGKKTEAYVILPGLETECFALAESVCKGNHTVTSATDKARELNLTLAKNQAEEARKAKEAKEAAAKEAAAEKEAKAKEAAAKEAAAKQAEATLQAAQKMLDVAKDNAEKEAAQRKLDEAKATEEAARKEREAAAHSAEQAAREAARAKQEAKDALKNATNAEIRASKSERREQNRAEARERGNDKGKDENKPASPADYAKMSVPDVAAHLFAILAKHDKPHSVLATLITHCDNAPKGTFDNATMRGIRAFIDASKKPAVKDNGPDGAK
jgi:DNA polymerase III gamma/tau subunit